MNNIGLIYQIASKVFKYKRVPIETKILAPALFLQGLSIRRISKCISYSKTAIHYWTLKFKESLNCEVKKKQRKRIAIDETKIKVNDKQYFIYAAVDLESGECLGMKAYTARNYLTTLDFIKHVLRYCANKDVEIMTDKMPCYKQVCDRLGIRWKHESFGKRNFVESLFYSFKFQTKRFCNVLKINLRKMSFIFDRNYWFKRVLYLLELWCKQFVFYWNFMR